MTEAELIDKITRTIATQSGFYAQGKLPSLAKKLNNPCCMAHWKDPDGQPYTEIMGVVEFPDIPTGWRAARAQSRINVFKRRLTFLEFFAGKPGVYKGFLPRDGSSKLEPGALARSVADAIAPGTDIHNVMALAVAA